jgi:hypothetical protein
MRFFPLLLDFVAPYWLSVLPPETCSTKRERELEDPILFMIYFILFFFSTEIVVFEVRTGTKEEK